MSVKETMVKAMQDAGYDTMTACEYAERTIAEFMQSGKQQNSYVCGEQVITIARGTNAAQLTTQYTGQVLAYSAGTFSFGLVYRGRC